MRRFLVILLIFLVFLPVFAESGTSNQPKLTIYVGGYNNPPKEYPVGNNSNNYVGIFPDLLKYIAGQENWNLVWVTCEWAVCLDKLSKNQINVMIDVAYSDPRAQLYDFNTVPVISNWAQSYSQVGKNYTSIQDLQGATIAVLNGSIHTDGPNGIKALLTKNNISVTYKYAQSYNDVLELVNNKTADFGITNRLNGLYTENQFKNIKRSFLVFDPVELYFAFHKGSNLTKELIPIFDKELLHLRNDPKSEYFVILNKYLGIEPQAVIPGWVVPLLVIISLIVLLLLVFSYFFKHQLNIRTKELRDLVTHQDEEIKRQTQDLLEKNEKLEEVDHLKSIFLASMSHELRTPLNSIIGFTKVLLLGMTGELNEEQQKQLNLIESNSEHLLDLINDILDISKIESGTVQLDYETFNLNSLLEEQIEIMKPLLNGKDIQINVNMQEEIVCRSDKRRLKQIINNILSNAIKFSEKGIVKVSLKKKSEKYFEITVEDQGIGIRQKDLQNLFKPFYQVETVSTKKVEGTGLGLYICKKLTTLLDGDLSILSEFSKGTKVSFHVPIKGKKQ